MRQHGSPVKSRLGCSLLSNISHGDDEIDDMNAEMAFFYILAYALKWIHDIISRHVPIYYGPLHDAFTNVGCGKS